MPDATGLELVAAEVREAVAQDAVTGTAYYRDQATLEVAPPSVHDVIEFLMRRSNEPYDVITTIHGCDYFPHEPRLCVQYGLLSRPRVDRLTVKTRMGVDEAEVPTVCDIFPGANYDEREVYDMFGVVFTGHPDMRRILLPEDYVGFPQRRDFPIGGEEVLFTFNEKRVPRWYD